MAEKRSWHNYRTGGYEIINTPEDFHDYIPQDPAAQSLYDLYIEHLKLSPINAAIKIWSAFCGELEAN